MNNGASLIEALVWMAFIWGTVFAGEAMIFTEIKKREETLQSLRLPYSGKREFFEQESR